MNFTPAQVAAVRAVMPGADDLTIRRHLQQRAELVRQQEQQRRERVAAALGSVRR